MISDKYGRLKALEGKPKVVILAGSNGRYSHSAKEIGRALGMNAVNLSVSANVSLDWQLDEMKKYLSSGDIVIMPLEFGSYNRSKKSSYSAEESLAMLMFDKDRYGDFPLERKIRTFARADFQHLSNSIVENIMTMAGMERREDEQNEYGDQINHTKEKAKDYEAYLNDSAKKDVDDTLDKDSFTAKKIADFLRWAKEHGIVVFGAYPTMPDTWKVPEKLLDDVKNLYISNGQRFINTDNRSKYPIGAFYDTPLHLNEENQIRHSKAMAADIIYLFNH